MENKRGQGLNITTIVVILLAVLVLVFLVYAFFTGTGPFTDTVKNLGTGRVNIQAVVAGCKNLCLTEDYRAFCTQERPTVVIFDESDKLYNGKRYTCAMLKNGGGRGNVDEDGELVPGSLVRIPPVDGLETCRDDCSQYAKEAAFGYYDGAFSG